MSERKTDDAKLIAAVRILSRTIQTEDGVFPAFLAEVANRLETLVEEERRWDEAGRQMHEANRQRGKALTALDNFEAKEGR